MRHIPGLLLVMLTSAALSAAQTPTTRLIPYSGTAVDGSGSPVSGQVAVTFELFEDQDGGAPLWRETSADQADDRGQYSVYLGAVTALPQIAFTQERARWLGVTIAGPRAAARHARRGAVRAACGGRRHARRSAGVGLRAQPADGRLETSAGLVAEAAVDGSGVPGQLAKFNGATSLSSSVISESATNRIGVGLPDPTGGGVVDSVFTIKNLDNNTGFAVLNQSQQRRFALNTLSTGAWSMYDGGTSTWNRGLTQVNGNVGIGTTAPVARLDVQRSDPFIDTPAAAFQVNNVSGVSPAVRAQVDSQFGNTTAAAIYAISAGTGGYAGYFDSPNSANLSWSLYVRQNGTGNALVVSHTGTSGNIATFLSGGTVARIDKTGKGFFDGGTQVGGADLAESFEVEPAAEAYEPGDVLEISVDHDRQLRKSAERYSTRVIGVYTTKPGVLLSDMVSEDSSVNRVPLGVVGVIPTKVSAENGPIRRGDLLVAAATPGHAMKAGAQPPAGSVIGKALANFDGPETGVIAVFVNVR